MRKFFSALLLLTSLYVFQSCAELSNALGSMGNVPLTDTDIANGLKEALNVGISNGVNELIKTDGYFGDQALKILLPPQARNAQEIIEKNIPGGRELIGEAVLKMNRAAEDAANEAKPIFVDAIRGMSITDARNILFGDKSAATQYLRSSTFQQLVSAYTPKINASLNKVGASQAWTALISPYNKVAGTIVGNAFGARTPINDNLGAYVTEKALEGVFLKVAGEELKIRDNISARVSPLLQRVFGELDKRR